MIALTHLAVVLLLIRLFKLDRNGAFTALLFGVFIDLDHLLGMADFIARDGWVNALNVNAALASDVQWKSQLHSPEGALFAGPVLAVSRFFVPLLAWGLHLVMDYVQIYYLGIFSLPEIVLLAGLVATLLWFEVRDLRDNDRAVSLAVLWQWEVTRVKAIAEELPVVRSIRRWKEPRGTSG